MNLDNTSAIKRLDSKNVAASIANLPKQIIAAWQDAGKVKISPTSGKADSIVFCGMGGSNLASELIKRAFGRNIKLPFVLVRSYNLPAFVNNKTLVIVCSYSGNTEETVSCLEQAVKAKAKIICLTSGGAIERLAKRYKLTLVKLNPTLNPSGQPRYDVGSQLGATLAVFAKLKIIAIKEKDLTAITTALSALGLALLPNSPLKNNPAKQLAKNLLNKSVYIVGADHLAASAHILANQINESSKQLASPYKIPELNHHFLEALTFPKNIIRGSAFLFLLGSLYPDRINKRIAITRQILDKKNIESLSISTQATNSLHQALEILATGSWLSFYLAMLSNVNPADIPWVDYFKQELGK